MVNWNRMSDNELEELRSLLFTASFHAKQTYLSLGSSLCGNSLCLRDNQEFQNLVNEIQEIQEKRAKARAIDPNSLIDEDIGQ